MTEELALPRDHDAEKAVLGAMMLSKTAIGDVAEIITAASFSSGVHGTIYDTILDLYNRGESADPITVADALRKTGDLPRIGGPGVLHGLVEDTPTAANADYYAQIIADCAQRCRLIEAGTRIAQMARSAGEVSEITDMAGAEFNAAVAARETSRGAFVGDDFEAYLDRLEARQRGDGAKGVPTGFTDLDALTGGLHPGQMVIVAARPALGKSTLALDVARACAVKNGRPCAFFSLEMSVDELRDRLMSAQARIALHHMRGGAMTDEDWHRFAKVTPRVTAAPLFIEDTPGQTVTSIKATCRRLQQDGGLDLVIIDYLQLLESGLKRAESRQIEVSTMSRNLKLLAKELQVPVVVLAQLNRGPEQRTDKKPVRSDLRESGSLEQDADVVILLHREDAYEPESPRAGEVDLIVAKHRNGPEAIITVASQLHYSRFVDMAVT